MSEPALAESTADRAYVVAHFVSAEAIERPGGAAWIGRAVPAATYRFADGTRWYAPDVWRLADDAGGPAGAAALFARRYHAACEALGIEPELAAAWDAYVAGEYGACLRDVTPENIAAKARLVLRLDRMLADPHPSDPAWRSRLRGDVEALSGLERPFADCDRLRFGRPTTRDRLITGARQRHPQAFGADADDGSAPVPHVFTAAVRWTGNLGSGTAAYADYGRDYRVTVPGKPAIVGSAAPAFGGARHRHNPEDLLVAALAACHLLSYLALCARHGVRVETYEDHARGVLAVGGGAGRFTEVVLAPRVGVAPGADRELAVALHDRAHAACFIAGSVRFPVRCVAEVVVADAPTAAPPRRDVAVRIPDVPGALATLGEAVGRAGVSVEGGGGFAVGGAAIVHVLLADAARGVAALRAAGLEVLADREVVTARLDQDRPGQLGALARAMADAGVNIASVYSDHDHQLILAVDDIAAARAVATAWAERRGE